MKSISKKPKHLGVHVCGQCGHRTFVSQRDVSSDPKAPDYRYVTDCCGSEKFEAVK